MSQDLSFGVGPLGFSQHDPGPFSLQVQISYYSSHKPLPLAYAVLYLTCVGKLGAMLRVWPQDLGRGLDGEGWGVTRSKGLFTKINSFCF